MYQEYSPTDGEVYGISASKSVNETQSVNKKNHLCDRVNAASQVASQWSRILGSTTGLGPTPYLRSRVEEGTGVEFRAVKDTRQVTSEGMLSLRKKKKRRRRVERHRAMKGIITHRGMGRRFSVVIATGSFLFGVFFVCELNGSRN
ncbi:hypothetical protein CDAR_385621 [Caerostris darwini]|uniref:Uncharacterized protein n=1 Tax=Caerostris darwini TaxID=1538125 RepID=A0AAV4M4X0_9ARAC|nr:hypothetical protein CDAR_385621 [Caerostris darwini]